MESMFDEARAFDQDISKWDVSRCRSAVGMFAGSGMSAADKAQKKPTFGRA
jgi:hypothetical protein